MMVMDLKVFLTICHFPTFDIQVLYIALDGESEIGVGEGFVPWGV